MSETLEPVALELDQRQLPPALLRDNRWLLGNPDLFLVQIHYLSDPLVKECVRDPNLFARQSRAINQPQEPLLTTNGVNLVSTAAHQEEASVV